MKVAITKKCITKGEQADPWGCPVALALKAKFPKRDVSVGSLTADVGDKVYRLPREVVTFIKNFDNGLPVEPTSFVLKKQV